jgi:hypothetical protein
MILPVAGPALDLALRLALGRAKCVSVSNRIEIAAIMEFSIRRRTATIERRERRIVNSRRVP